MKKRAKQAKGRKAEPKAFTAWCIYRADGTPTLGKTWSGISAVIRASTEDHRTALRLGNAYREDGAPHRVVRVRITPFRKGKA